MLECSTGNSKSQLHKARLKLRELLRLSSQTTQRSGLEEGNPMNDNGRAADYDTMTPAEFEHVLPELFASGSPQISTDPRLQSFLARNPDCSALVRDLEAIAQAARDMFQVEVAEPSDSVWSKIQKEMSVFTSEPAPEAE